MKLAIFLTLLLAVPCWSQVPSNGQPDETPSFVNEATIKAPIADVWKVWSTSEGYKLLGVALADVDFRIGGLIRSHYKATGALGDDETIENRILAYEPKHMLAICIDRPPKSFPFKEAWKKTWTVITLTEATGTGTHMRIASMGFGSDDESISMRRFFEAGNAATLITLQNHFDTASTTRNGRPQ